MDDAYTMSIVRENLLERPGYTPYCGNPDCYALPRSRWNGRQFECRSCGWQSAFPAEFIAKYRAKWHEPNGLPAADGAQE